MNKKIVFLPYDFDTAIGINNEGALVLDYHYEDTDHINGEDVFNGQGSVLWNNLRECYGDELKAMFQQLRSSGALSYAKVEQAFEDHQSKWPEAIFNEDAFFKYIQPLITDGDESYLSMLQGSKTEQRKWWLYNRFKYLDSKYNAGDSLTDRIQLRGYNKANITLTPYADIYASIKWGSYLDTQRAPRNVAKQMVCPMDNLNDTEIYIYSASQLSSLGDLSGLKVGFADFHNATKLQDLILGSSASGYTNLNLRSINVGNLKLLKKIDARNCSGLGTFADQKTIDLSGCSGIEEVYFDGTNILGVELPNGGFMKKLHLPATITNLTVRNQSGISEFVCPDLSNVTTLNLEGVGSGFNIANILDALPYVAVTPDGDEDPSSLKWYEEGQNNTYIKTSDTTVTANKNYYTRGTRVRLLNFYWEFQNVAAVHAFLDKFDGMTGIDQNGDNTEKPQIYATVHVPTVTGDEVDAIQARYPDITVEADTATFYLRYYNAEGDTLLYTETVQKNQNGTYSAEPTHEATAQYTFAFIGWSTYRNSSVADVDALNNLTSNRKVYAAYTRTIQTYTVVFKNSNGTVLQTLTDVPYGSTATYTGEAPTHPTDSQTYTFSRWEPSNVNISGNTECIAVYVDLNTPFVKYLMGTLQNYESNTATKLGRYVLFNRSGLRTVVTSAKTIGDNCFATNSDLISIDFTNATELITLGSGVFNSCYKLDEIIIRSNQVTSVPNAVFSGANCMMYGPGVIYVQDSLVDSYKSQLLNSGVFDSKIMAYKIKGLSTYPLSDISTVLDTWAQIIAAASDGTHSTKYTKYDYKMLTYGPNNEYSAYMQYVHDRPEGPVWIVKMSAEDDMFYNQDTGVLLDYDSSYIDTYLNTTLFNMLPSELQNAIENVPITYYDAIDNTEKVINRKIWLLSSKEVGATGTSCKETNGYVFDGLKASNSSRIRYSLYKDSTVQWYTRTNYSSSQVSYVSSNGAVAATGTTKTTKMSLVFGFVLSGPSN